MFGAVHTVASASPIVGAAVPTVEWLAIAPSVWHLVGRVDARAQPGKRADHVCIHGCVCGYVCSKLLIKIPVSPGCIILA